jgi:hypothetical protein
MGRARRDDRRAWFCPRCSLLAPLTHQRAVPQDPGTEQATHRQSGQQDPATGILETVRLPHSGVALGVHGAASQLFGGVDKQVLHHCLNDPRPNLTYFVAKAKQ